MGWGWGPSEAGWACPNRRGKSWPVEQYQDVSNIYGVIGLSASHLLSLLVLEVQGGLHLPNSHHSRKQNKNYPGSQAPGGFATFPLSQLLANLSAAILLPLEWKAPPSLCQQGEPEAPLQEKDRLQTPTTIPPTLERHGPKHLLFLSCLSSIGTSEGKGQAPLCLGCVRNALLNAQTTFKVHWSLCDGLNRWERGSPMGPHHRAPSQVLKGLCSAVVAPATPWTGKGLIPPDSSLALSNVPEIKGWKLLKCVFQ